MQTQQGFSSPNWTQIPNKLIDEYMSELKGSELMIMLAICRKTIGWHKQCDDISGSQLAEITGLARETISRSVQSLEEKNLIIANRKQGCCSTYEVVRDPEEAKKCNKNDDEPVIKDHRRCDKRSQEPVTKDHTQKKGLNKEKEIYSDEFEKFWDLYDSKEGSFSLKKGKRKAWQEWKRLTEADKKKVMEHVPIFHTHFSDKKFTPRPRKYLHNRYWEDEGFQKPSNQNSQDNGQRKGNGENRTQTFIRRGQELFGEEHV